MLRLLLAVALALWAGLAPASAQDRAVPDLPALFTVTGVDWDDVLNLRAEPDAAAAIAGTLQPGSMDVEVLSLSPDGQWGLVPLGEGSGWVAMRFLVRQREAPTPLPRPLLCRGTEPFWSLTLDSQGHVFERPGEGVQFLRQHGEVAGFGGGVMAFDLDGQTLDLTIVREACSDGMSDRPYGLTAFVWNRGETFLEGCCTLSAH